MASTIQTYPQENKAYNVEGGQLKNDAHPTVEEVGGVEVSSFDYTEEESRAVARKFDLRVSDVVGCGRARLMGRSCRGSSSATSSTRSTGTTSPTPSQTAWTVRFCLMLFDIG
jgi:hypothetical protein